MLTPNQSRALNFIHTFTVEHGYGPSFSEIRDDLGLKSKSGVFLMVEALIQRGFLASHGRRMARSLTVLKLPGPQGALETKSGRCLRLAGEIEDLMQAPDALGPWAHLRGEAMRITIVTLKDIAAWQHQRMIAGDRQ